jgi:glycosyltransferase involved in cell wall biosynthesis
MVIVQITTDNREPYREYDKTEPWFGTAPEALFQGFAMLPEVTVHVVTCTQQAMRSPEKLAPNIHFHSLHVPKFGWMRTGYQGCIRAVRRKLRDIRPDVVHGQGTERECSVSAVLSGYPNVLTIHGNMRLIARLLDAKPFSYHWLAAQLEGLVLPRTDGVVCITKYTQKAVQQAARKTWVLPNAVDAAFFDVAPKPDEVPLLLCVGTVTRRKNQNDFLRALDPLAQQLPFRVLFLGAASPDDPYGREFFKLLSERPWAKYGGFINRQESRQVFGRASLLVLPTLEDNCPMVVLEAMAAGVPVVASRVGGIPELIDNELTGLFCEPQRPETIREAVRRVLADPALRLRLSVAGKQSALDRFCPKVIAKQHLAIYRTLLGSSRKAVSVLRQPLAS